MCFFPKEMIITDSFGNQKQIECGCGHCPECLKKKSRQWALRCYYESLYSPAMMVTLTYDEFVRGVGGRIIGERLHANGTKCEKKHIQDFVKRLRKYITTKVDKNIRVKYLCTAERGKTHNRAHYHMIIFGYTFNDLVFHKYSKRGYPIYRSKTLADIWTHGICTVDCVNITPAVAQYCTKYCSKDSGKQNDDTFMLFSRGIGMQGLLDNFNGLRYIIEGQDYPIPRLVWQKIILGRYSIFEDYACDYSTGEVVPFSFKYRGKEYGDIDNPVRIFYRKANSFARKIRDTDPLYVEYITFWKQQSSILENKRLSVEERIKALDNEKYFSYKCECLAYLNKKKNGQFTPFIPREKFSKEKLHKCFTVWAHWKPKEFTTIKSAKNSSIPFDTCYDTAVMEKLDLCTDFPFPIWYTGYVGNKYLKFPPILTYDEYRRYCKGWKRYLLGKSKSFARSTCCISANDTKNEFLRFAQRFDIEKEMQKPLSPYKSQKIRHKYLTFKKPCVTIGVQGSFVTQTTL